MKPKINSQNLFLLGKAFIWRSTEAVGTQQPVESATVSGNMGFSNSAGRREYTTESERSWRSTKANGEAAAKEVTIVVVELGFFPREVHSSS
jgi:hypothetical protein